MNNAFAVIVALIGATATVVAAQLSHRLGRRPHGSRGLHAEVAELRHDIADLAVALGQLARATAAGRVDRTRATDTRQSRVSDDEQGHGR